MLGLLDECKDQLLRLAGGSTPTSQLATRAAELAGGYWQEFDPQQRQQFQQWLDGLYADAQRLVAIGPAMNVKLRQAEVAMGALEAIKQKAPPARG
jgi:hypothetical protein